MILQRYTFGSKSQRSAMECTLKKVAYDIAKIYIWKQITTKTKTWLYDGQLLMILQRYTFGSKSQLTGLTKNVTLVAYDIAKIYIWKQITTIEDKEFKLELLLMILQRYTFGSKSQRISNLYDKLIGCL